MSKLLVKAHQNHAEDPTEDPTVGTIADPA
jgi:hypothetical protein